MNPGTLNQRISFEQWDEDRETWNSKPFYQCWAAVNGLSGQEYWAAKAMQAENTVKFTIRYCKKLEQITPQGFSILFLGKRYDIEQMDHVKYGKRMMIVKAVEKLGRDSKY